MARVPWIWYTSIEKKNETIVMLCKIENVFWKYDRNIEETNDKSNVTVNQTKTFKWIVLNAIDKKR